MMSVANIIKAKKNGAVRRYLSSICGGGGVFCEMLGGAVTLIPLPYQRHMPIQLILWEYDPRVWLDFIRVVVLSLLCRIKFH